MWGYYTQPKSQNKNWREKTNEQETEKRKERKKERNAIMTFVYVYGNVMVSTSLICHDSYTIVNSHQKIIDKAQHYIEYFVQFSTTHCELKSMHKYVFATIEWEKMVKGKQLKELIWV